MTKSGAFQYSNVAYTITKDINKYC